MKSIDWTLCLVVDAEAAGARKILPIIEEGAEDIQRTTRELIDAIRSNY